MTEKTYKIGNVAKMLDLTVPGLRKWAQQYGDHLSAYANPGAGKPRRFTEQDVSTLQRIAKMRSDGALSHQDVKLRLDMESVAEEDEPEPPEAAQETPGTAIAPASAIDAAALATLLQTVQSDSIKAERLHVVEDEQRQQRSDISQIRLLLVLVLIAVLVLSVLLVLVLAMR